MSGVGSNGGGGEMLMEGGRGGGEFAKSKTVNNGRIACRNNESCKHEPRFLCSWESSLPEGDGVFMCFFIINATQNQTRETSATAYPAEHPAACQG